TEGSQAQGGAQGDECGPEHITIAPWFSGLPDNIRVEVSCARCSWSTAYPGSEHLRRRPWSEVAADVAKHIRYAKPAPADPAGLDAAIEAARDAFDLECSKVVSVLDDPDEAEDRPWRAAIAAAYSSALREAADEMENAIITRLSAAWPTIFGDDETFTEQVAREILALLRERAGRIGGGE
ncbi:MAG TPA: hypothetical protein VNH17_17330, partial [Streptosporangiaceae bacterium]|nr:hypothetical protein [Streptosporangiaceae bacterium]